jgi:hypothetical protein
MNQNLSNISQPQTVTMGSTVFTPQTVTVGNNIRTAEGKNIIIGMHPKPQQQMIIQKSNTTQNLTKQIIHTPKTSFRKPTLSGSAQTSLPNISGKRKSENVRVVFTQVVSLLGLEL